MALTTKFNDGTKGQANVPKAAADHQAEVDAEAKERRERDKADLAAESAGWRTAASNASAPAPRPPCAPSSCGTERMVA